MYSRPPRNPCNFTPKQSQVLSSLFTANKFPDARECREIALLLKIPEVVITLFFDKKLLKEKLPQEELYQITVIKRNYDRLLQLLENNFASTDSPTCSASKQQKMSNDIRSIPVTKYLDEVFQLFNFCNKNRIMLKDHVIPRHFIAISVNSDRAIEFYKQYRIYMARVKAREPSSVEVGIFSETFPVLASDEDFERLVTYKKGRTLDEVYSNLRDEVISIALETSVNTVFYEPPEQVCERIKYYAKNIPMQQDKQDCGNETASATLRVPTNNAVNTSSAQSLTETFAQRNNHRGRPKISQVNQLFRNETDFVATESPVVITEADHAFKTDPSPMDHGSSQCSSEDSNLVIQEQRARQTGEDHQITEVEPLSQFIKYCILIKTAYDQVIGNDSVSAVPPQFPTTSTSTIPVPNVSRFINPSQPLIRKVPIQSQSLEELRKRRAMPLHSQISLVPSGSMPLQPDRMQPSLVEPSTANQLSVFDKNRHPLITAPDRVHILGTENVRPSITHYTIPLDKCDGGRLYASDEAHPSIPNSINPYDSARSYHIHPNYDVSGHSRPGAIPFDKCDGGQIYESNEAHPSIPNRINAYDITRSKHIHRNYDGSRRSKPRVTPLDKNDGAGQLIRGDKAHPTLADLNGPCDGQSNHVHPSEYNDSGNSTPGAIPLDRQCRSLPIICEDSPPSELDRIKPDDNNDNDCNVRNLSGRSRDLPLHTTIGVRVNNPNEERHPPLRVQTQPKPLYGRGVRKEEKQQDLQEAAPPSNN